MLKLANHIKGKDLRFTFAARILSFPSVVAPIAAMAVLMFTAEPQDGKIWVPDSTVEPLNQATQQPALSLDLVLFEMTHFLIV